MNLRVIPVLLIALSPIACSDGGDAASASSGTLQGEPIQGEPIQGEPIQGEPIQGEPIAGAPIDSGPADTEEAGAGEGEDPDPVRADAEEELSEAFSESGEGRKTAAGKRTDDTAEDVMTDGSATPSSTTDRGESSNSSPETTTASPKEDAATDSIPEDGYLTAANPAQHRINLAGALEKAKKPLIPNDKGIVEVSFGHLASFPYIVPDPFLGEEEPEVPNEIPPRIQALDGKKVQVEGYMIPLDFNDEDEVTLFILSAFVDNCCFGKQANVNEWVEVELDDDQGVHFYPDGVVQVTGKLEVGELKDAYGYVSGIYRMRAEEVVEVW